MGYRWFPSDGSRLVVIAAGGQFRPAAGGTAVPLYVDEELTVPASGVLHGNGAALAPESPLRVDAYSQVPPFQVPDTLPDVLYTSINGGPAWPIYSRPDDRIDALEVASADHLARSANLSDLASPSAARSSLGLGTAATRDTGTGSTQSILGSDARLTDARVPTAHHTTHATGGTDALTPASIGAETAANRGASGGYAPLDAAGLLPAARLPSFRIAPSSLVFYGASTFNLVSGVLVSAGYRTDRLVCGLLGLPENRIANYAVSGCKLLQSGAASGGFATVLQQEPKSARTSPYAASGGVAVLDWGLNDLGAYGATTQVLNAYADALRAVISRHRSSTVREDTDASWTYANGAGATSSTTTINSGSAYRAFSVVGRTFQLTLPSDFPGGTIVIGLIGTPGAAGGTIAWSGNASRGTTGTTSTSNTMPSASGVSSPLMRRLTGLTSADAGKTIIGTVTTVDASGFVNLDYWALEAALPPLVVVCGRPRILNYSGYTGIGDTDVLALNAVTQSVVAEYDSAVVYVDLDSGLGKNAAYFATDGVHQNEAGCMINAKAIVNAIAAAGRTLDPYQLMTDYT